MDTPSLPATKAAPELQLVLCPGCRQLRTLSEFGKDKHRPTGLAFYCKCCKSARTRQWREENPGAVKEYNDSYVLRKRFEALVKEGG